MEKTVSTIALFADSSPDGSTGCHLLCRRFVERGIRQRHMSYQLHVAGGQLVKSQPESSSSVTIFFSFLKRLK
ncbi:hypothetical protein NPIL_387921 [Nephila pilipes]|uniref:Uncharacterized protein n=1 Tax=Nephila pilipes TaxID=299642 RepID=A0A8X6P0B5_NEPPI|nr:hypothetical protein NPIL_387921 [Nephila pilipes]